MTPTHILERIDPMPLPMGGPRECRAIIVTLNEADRMSWLLDYYRSIGVVRFFVIDNGSTDGTLEFLLQQKDCHVFATSDSYHQSHFGGVWQQRIFDKYGEKHWWLIIDADEMFVYPESEHVSLPTFCDYLESKGAEGVSAFMMDMYSKEPVAQATYRKSRPFTETCPYFDPDYSFWPRPRHLKMYAKKGLSVFGLRHNRAPLLFPAMEPVGGPRLRRFYPQYKNSGPFELVKMKVIRRLRDKLRTVGIKMRSHVPPVLFKVPLLKGGTGVKILDPHSVSPIVLADVTGVLLHFKFFADFHNRVMDAVDRGEHFDGASEYARYLQEMKAEPALSFYYDKSVRFESSQQLVALGLILDDVSYKDYRREQASLS